MKFDVALWKAAAKAAKKVRRSTTAFIELATEEKLFRLSPPKQHTDSLESVHRMRN